MPSYTGLQGSTSHRDKIINIFFCIDPLEALFAAQAGDAAEQGYWDELIRYAFLPLLDPVLSSFQPARRLRGTVAVGVSPAPDRVAGTWQQRLQSRQRHVGGSRKFTRDHLQLSGLFIT